MNSAKYCEMCGRFIAAEQDCDYYRYIRLKYCDKCAAAVHRRQIAESMRKARAKARERRELERQQTTLTSQENELLRELLRQQSARIADLEKLVGTGGKT